MKRFTRFLVAIALITVLSMIATGVWAGPGRRGTVPFPPKEFTGACGVGTWLNFGTGVARVERSCTFSLRVIDTFKEVKQRFGLPSKMSLKDWLPKGDWKPQFSYILINITENTAELEEICVPLSPKWRTKQPGKNLIWFVWDPKANEWIEAKTDVKEDRTPPWLCGLIERVDFPANPGLFDENALFALLGK